MILNTQQLQYLVEIQRAGSVSLAASNLYMSQPNLSRTLKEIETALGFEIFERTRKGVLPTKKGAILLQLAQNMLRDAQLIQQLGSHCFAADRFRICLPLSYAYGEITSRFLRTLSGLDKLETLIQQCRPRQALELLDNRSVDLAVLRYRTEHATVYRNHAARQGLTFLPLAKTEYLVTISENSPLATRDSISKVELEKLTQILPRDSANQSHPTDISLFRICAIDWMLQLQLLQSIPNSFLWSEPLPAQALERYSLVQLPCTDGGPTYHDAVIYNPQTFLSATEKQFLTIIQS